MGFALGRESPIDRRSLAHPLGCRSYGPFPGGLSTKGVRLPTSVCPLGALTGTQTRDLNCSRLVLADRALAPPEEAPMRGLAGDGESMIWTGAEGRFEGLVSPVATFLLTDGRRCREYRQRFTAGQITASTAGTVACQQPDGGWVRLQE